MWRRLRFRDSAKRLWAVLHKVPVSESVADPYETFGTSVRCSSIRIEQVHDQTAVCDLKVIEAVVQDDAPAITVTMRDVRCSMVNLDPDSASPAPEVLKAGRSCEPEQRGNLRRGHSHRSTGGRTDHISILQSMPCL
jgi:hypothetical protein